MYEDFPRRKVQRPARPMAETRERQVKALAAEPKAPVPEDFVDPAAGIVFPQRLRRRH